jgi:hypothetical protein
MLGIHLVSTYSDQGEGPFGPAASKWFLLTIAMTSSSLVGYYGQSKSRILLSHIDFILEENKQCWKPLTWDACEAIADYSRM